MRLKVYAHVQITNIKEEDIVFVRFDTDVIAQSCLPYFIALDHATKSVGRDSECSTVAIESHTYTSEFTQKIPA